MLQAAKENEEEAEGEDSRVRAKRKICEAMKVPPPLPNLSLLTKTLTYSNISSSSGSNALRGSVGGGTQREESGIMRDTSTRVGVVAQVSASFLKDSVFRGSGISSFTLSKNSTGNIFEKKPSLLPEGADQHKPQEDKIIESELTAKLKILRSQNEEALSHDEEEATKLQEGHDGSTIRKQLNFSTSLRSLHENNSGIAPEPVVSAFKIEDAGLPQDPRKTPLTKSEDTTFSFA